jgi:hypothetical protein
VYNSQLTVQNIYKRIAHVNTYKPSKEGIFSHAVKIGLDFCMP